MDPNRSHLIVLFHCRMGTDQTGKDPRTSKYVLGGAHGRSHPILLFYCTNGADWTGHVKHDQNSDCFVETELIGPAMLNGAPPKHDDMQCVAYVSEMSHFVVLRGRIFVDQLMQEIQCYGCLCW
jgi:hypothetical protein